MMLLNMFEHISMSVTPRHLLLLLILSLIVMGTAWHLCHLERSIWLCQYVLRKEYNMSRLYGDSDLKALGGTSLSTGDLSFSSFFAAFIRCSHLIDLLISDILLHWKILFRAYQVIGWCTVQIYLG